MISEKELRIALLVLFLAALSQPALSVFAAEGKSKPAPDIWEAAAKFKFGDDEKVLVAAAAEVQKAAGNPAAKKQVEAKLAALVENATPDAKRFACRQLWMVGTAQAVPALAKLLPDEQLSDAARYALERMQDQAAGAALRDAAGKLKGKPLVGVLDSIGGRRDPAAVPLITPLLADSDRAVAAAAAWALGRIGTSGAADALAAARAKADPQAKRGLDDAYLLAADALAAAGKRDAAAAIYRQMSDPKEPRHVRAAASRGLPSLVTTPSP
jgi:HEAT repeat protein